MYHFKTAPAGSASLYQPPRPNQFAAYPPQPPGPPGQYPALVAHQQTQQPQYDQYAPTQQPQAPGVYPFSQAPQLSGAYTSNQHIPYPQQQQAHGLNPATGAGGFPHAATYQSSNQSCYNCGDSNHWAQNCPEARRVVPAGALNGPRPVKRQKTTGPIVTRYPPPTNHVSPPSLQRGFTHPPAGHPTFPAQPGPPTPLSANCHSYNSWRPQQHQNSFQPPRQSSQQWSPLPTPTSSYGPPYASPVSVNDPTQHQNYFSSQSQASASQGSPPGNLIPLHSSPSVQSRTYTKQPVNTSRLPSVSSDRNQVLEANGDGVEPWLEELQALDFTEGKVGAGPIISHPANPVAQPLPADCAVADSIGRLPIAASLPPGVSISMYFRNLDEQEFERNVREKADWNEICNDPAFVEINSDCDAVSVSELIRRRQDEALGLDGSDNEAERSDYDAHSRDQYSDDERHTRGRSYSDRSVTTFEAKPPVFKDPPRTCDAEEQDHPTHSIERGGTYSMTQEAEDQRLSREQEERLAALGVSGLPKPVQPSIRRNVAVTQPPKGVVASPAESVDRQSRSTSLDKRASYTESRASPSPDSLNGLSRDRSRELSHLEGSPYQNASAARHSPRPHFSRENSQQDRHGREPLTRYRSYDGRQPPPPPPPPLPPARMHRYFDEHADRHSSSPDVRFHDSTTNGHYRPSAGEDTHQFQDISSPSRSKSDPDVARKRPYRHSSDESDEGPKRQEEESAQQRKRKHPKVADAYSRRW